MYLCCFVKDTSIRMHHLLLSCTEKLSWVLQELILHSFGRENGRGFLNTVSVIKMKVEDIAVKNHAGER